MITDFSDLDAVGRQHYMTLEGGCASEMCIRDSYKPYATLEEIAQDQKAEHYGEFMQVMNFLFYEPWKREH